MWSQPPPKTLYIYRFPYWKHPVVKQCFPGSTVVFVESLEKLPELATLVLWGRATVAPGLPLGVSIWRMEDGFLRSVGLGADLVRPISWVLDRTGIYYDTTGPSDLEQLLLNHHFDESLKERAAQLRVRVVQAGLTKYNVGAQKWQRPAGVQTVILVPGQVESDASLAYGAPGVQTNMGLLQAVRLAHPQAYVVYKPHPDVEARLRAVGVREPSARLWCDEMVTEVLMGDLLNHVDAVHVMTSLAGFEALLRNKPVTCYGQPFYAGWGLTEDLLPLSRPRRPLDLDELVAGVLIGYPLYLSRASRCLISPEQALDELSDWVQKTGGRTPWWRHLIRVFLRRIIGVR
jgi:capsular polysaccharide export protein